MSPIGRLAVLKRLYATDVNPWVEELEERKVESFQFNRRRDRFRQLRFD